MAEYTITIKDDDDFGIVVNLSGPSNLSDLSKPQGAAARLALGLVTLAPRLISGAPCDCDKCRAARELSDDKPTIH
ncbi:hypothetical protein [Pseudomonas sp. FP833]|uniref:hypothetical protein n=1 Tax=Pseudomonas sp. FP833 TaxID=2954102 RepID=UPI002734730E|nr:hypothetical protein [Pseudomonas sp. FP833]WLI50635.1 hypothetical protein PSH63_30315 [Pseudomonas sp. FP833]